MARGRSITVSGPEREALAAALEALDAAEGGVLFPLPRAVRRSLRSLLDKANAAVAPVLREEPGMSLAALETAMEPAGERYARWRGGSPARHLRDLHLARATPEAVSLVARYVASWTRFDGAITLGTLARKWGEYLAAATAWAERERAAVQSSAAVAGTSTSHWE